MPPVLYVYAIGEDVDRKPLRDLETVDGRSTFSTVGAAGLLAVCSEVDPAEFSQEGIDRHADDLQWLGTVGYRHEAVVASLARASTVIPLRAFTLFSTSETLKAYLSEEASSLKEMLRTISGRDEWTIRLEFEPEAWSAAMIRRVESLRRLSDEIRTTSEGKAFLLRKKLDEEKKKSAREAEKQVIDEVQLAVESALPSAPQLFESRQQKSGSFPQINVLVARGEEERLRQACNEQQRLHEGDGVRLSLTGPWPPYSFVTGG